MLAFAVLLWAGFAVVVWAVLAGHTAQFDTVLLRLPRMADGAARGPGWGHEMMRDVTALGGVLLRNFFALIGVGIAAFVLRWRGIAVWLFVTVASGWLVNSVMKYAFARPRPELVPHLAEADGPAFPSGHSFNGAVVYVALALAFAPCVVRASARHALIGAAMVLAALIAMSRIGLGVHWPSDALAGWLGGTGWAVLCAAAFRPLPIGRDTARA
ncbi:phosphatase PAP2 family protein [Croceicoccus hydrothermalis]|uniref:phosphatase PAP2 family protein n=1 Tax=Croceicoccus hydrothermalis TaxID=2867964 RepID=UPI001EFA5044|nr:phosphatase PAP2 family protein [Croceicoccus hydrothermalis]